MYPYSSPPTKGFQGNRQRGLWRFRDEGIRVFTTWKFKNLLCFQLWSYVGLETKTPPERGLGRGSIVSNFGRASAHPALARKRARVTAQVKRPAGILLRDEWRGAHHQSLSQIAGDNRLRWARCMIVDRGEVKARVDKKWDTRAMRTSDLHHALADVLAGEEADERVRKLLEAVDDILVDLELAARHP